MCIHGGIAVCWLVILVEIELAVELKFTQFHIGCYCNVGSLQVLFKSTIDIFSNLLVYYSVVVVDI